MCLNLSPLVVSYKPQAGQRKIPVAASRSVNVLPVMMNPNRGSLGMDQRIGHPQLDEGLTRDADASGFSIDRAQ